MNWVLSSLHDVLLETTRRVSIKNKMAHRKVELENGSWKKKKRQGQTASWSLPETWMYICNVYSLLAVCQRYRVTHKRWDFGDDCTDLFYLWFPALLNFFIYLPKHYVFVQWQLLRQNTKTNLTSIVLKDISCWH